MVAKLLCLQVTNNRKLKCHVTWCVRATSLFGSAEQKNNFTSLTE